MKMKKYTLLIGIILMIAGCSGDRVDPVETVETSFKDNVSKLENAYQEKNWEKMASYCAGSAGTGQSQFFIRDKLPLRGIILDEFF